MSKLACPYPNLAMHSATAAPTTTPPTPGEWVAYSYGKDIRGWHLYCGGMFHADIGPGPKGYLVTLNMHPSGDRRDADELKHLAERAIVDRIRHMLPAYKVIHVRSTSAPNSKAAANKNGATSGAVFIGLSLRASWPSPYGWRRRSAPARSKPAPNRESVKGSGTAVAPTARQWYSLTYGCGPPRPLTINNGTSPEGMPMRGSEAAELKALLIRAPFRIRLALQIPSACSAFHYLITAYRI